jgi:hypothetical protein
MKTKLSILLLNLLSLLTVKVYAEGGIALAIEEVEADYLTLETRTNFLERLRVEVLRCDQYRILALDITEVYESEAEVHMFFRENGVDQILSTVFTRKGSAIILNLQVFDLHEETMLAKITITGEPENESAMIAEAITKLCSGNENILPKQIYQPEEAVGDAPPEFEFAEESANDSRNESTISHTTDLTAPVITILDPAVTRGMRLKNKKVLVKGSAKDDSGIYEVYINGIEAQMSSSGEFWAEVPLAMGENKITVRASDTKQNTAEESFTIVREGEAPPPVTTKTQAPTVSIAAGKYFALLIGVQEYRDKSINPLSEPLGDVEKIRSQLATRYTFEPQNIIVLKNPVRTAIMDKFDELSHRVTKQDNLLIFYAGHGYWDEQFKQGYWLPSDARKDNRGEWISNGTIVDYIRGIQSNHTLLIADACFSGGIFQTRSAFSDAPPAIEEMYKLSSRKAITSGTLKEVPDRSVFVEYLTKRLSDNNEPYLTSEQLFVSFRTAVINNSPIKQVPQYGEIRESGDEGGDFVFIKKIKL